MLNPGAFRAVLAVLLTVIDQANVNAKRCTKRFHTANLYRVKCAAAQTTKHDAVMRLKLFWTTFPVDKTQLKCKEPSVNTTITLNVQVVERLG